MNSLLVLYDTFTSGYIDISLNIISLLSVLCGIFVIISKNPIVSILFLIGLFFSIACYLLVLGISFIGLSYLLVYVGAVSILFLFILMLINVRISELLNDTSNSIPLALIAGLSFFYSVSGIFFYSFTYLNYNFKLDTWRNLFNIDNAYSKLFNIYNYSKTVFVAANAWESSLAETTHISSIGNIMYTSYSMWLIMTSIILLLAMVGAIVITIKESK